MKKIIVFILVVVLLSSTLVGCKKDKENTTTGNNSEKVLMTIVDRKIILSEAIFFLLSIQNQYEQQYGADVMSQPSGQGGTVGDMVKSQALEETQTINLAAYEAEQQGITLTEEEKQAQLDKAKATFEVMDPTIVAENGFTLEMIQNAYVKYAISQKFIEGLLADHVVTEEEMQSELALAAQSDAYYAAILKYGVEGSALGVRAKHILIMTVDDNRNPLPQDQIDAALVKANEALAKAKAGENFSDLIQEYSEDPGSLSPENAEGYIFGRGDFVSEFEDAAYSMEPGDISDIVESQYGYHIIELEEKNIAPAAEELTKRQEYNTKIEEQAKNNLINQYLIDQKNTWEEKYKPTIDTAIWDVLMVKGQTGSPEAEAATAATTETTEVSTEAPTETTTSK